MKKLLLILCCVTAFTETYAQVVFCPPGAEWSYNFFWSAGGAPGAQQMLLEKISYTHDSVLGPDVVKVLGHLRFYKECGVVWNANTTLIKQKGDTVYMRNAATNQNWQILYNFNVTAGDSWQTEVKGDASNLVDPTTIPYTVWVDSVKYLVESGFSLKRLYVRYEHYNSWSTLISEPTFITERFGCYDFLFNYYDRSEGGCDGDWFQRNLCYKDTQFGTKQFTTYPCDYSNLTGIGENLKGNEILNMYPNPVRELLFIKTDLTVQMTVTLTDICGRDLMSQLFQGTAEIRTDQLATGIYFLKVARNSEIIYTSKVIKE